MNNADEILGKNDKVKCYLLRRDGTTGHFIVQVQSSGLIGHLNVAPDDPLMPDICRAVGSKEPITLYFNYYNKKGKGVFSLNPINNIGKRDNYQTSSSNDKIYTQMDLHYSSSDAEYNRAVFDALLATIDIVDTDEKCRMSEMLLEINRTFQFDRDLPLEIFIRSIPKYQSILWSEGYVPFVSNTIVRNQWSSASDPIKDSILKKLGITLPEPKRITNEVVKIKEVPVCNVTPVFEQIGEEIIRLINSSSHTIHIAMAWFTNFDIFKACKKALERNVKVVLVTNNDLINNGGYCLDFNKLIDAGLELHLAEYPDMMHHKFCIIDNAIVVNGSYNWTFAAEDINLEDVVIIKDAPEVVKLFSDRFRLLTEQFAVVKRMPDTVPEKPEYDRGSFKQYICEELVARTRRNIGSAKDNIRRACKLSPTFNKVQNAIKEYKLENDSECIEYQENHEKQSHPIQTTSHFEKIEDELVTRLSNAQKSVKIAVSWILSLRLVNKLKELSAKGVSVNVVTNNDLINNGICSTFNEILKANISLYLAEPNQKLVHHKFCIIDDKVLINGSYDMTSNSSDNQENIMVIENDTNAISSFNNEFERLIKTCDETKIAPASLSTDKPENDRTAYRQYVTKELNTRAYQTSSQTTRIESLEKAATFNEGYLAKINPNYKEQMKMASEVLQTSAQISEALSDKKPSTQKETGNTNVKSTTSAGPSKSDPSSNQSNGPSGPIPQGKTVPPTTSTRGTSSISPQNNTTPKIQNSKVEEEVHEQILKVAGVSSFFMGVDVSGSMENFFKSGLAHNVIKKAIVCAASMSSNPSISVWTYNNNAQYRGAYNINNASNLSQINNPNGGTEMKEFVKAIFSTVNKSLVFIFTDGDDFHPDEVASLMKEKPDTYWQILGCGNNFSKIKNAISPLSNASLVVCDNIASKNDEEIKQMILGNYLSWKKSSSAT